MENIYDMKHVKSVQAFALLLNGKLAGKIVANYSDNFNGSSCTASLFCWAGVLANNEAKNVKPMACAGGYGYDKLASCMNRLDSRLSEGNWEASVRELGYELESII